MSDFSLPWRQDSDGAWRAGPYEAKQVGNAWELRFAGTLIDDWALNRKQCFAKADRHRGVSR